MDPQKSAGTVGLDAAGVSPGGSIETEQKKGSNQELLKESIQQPDGQKIEAGIEGQQVESLLQTDDHQQADAQKMQDNTMPIEAVQKLQADNNASS